MNMSIIALAILATWGLSALIYFWKGLEWLHKLAGGYDDPPSWLGRQLNCFWCVSVIVSFPVSLLAYFAPWALYPPALTGASILLAKGGRIIWANMQE